MKIFNILKKITGFDEQNKLTSISSNKCRCEIKLKSSEFILLCRYYYVGYTSYGSFFKKVWHSDPTRTLEIMEKAKKLANGGCEIESTFIYFYLDSQNFIEIPFDVYSDKRELPISIRNTRTWNKNNILRILKLYPYFTEYDSEILS
jgi:hypothetical protein